MPESNERIGDAKKLVTFDQVYGEELDGEDIAQTDVSIQFPTGVSRGNRNLFVRIGDEFKASIRVVAQANADTEYRKIDVSGTLSFHLQPVMDPYAISVDYVSTGEETWWGEVVDEDVIVLDYEYDLEVLNSAGYMTRLYWSTDACISNDQGSISIDCYQERFILPAHEVGQGGFSDVIPVSSLKHRPMENGEFVSRYTHLVLHVDDGLSPTHQGDMSERDGDDPSDNYAVLKISPKFVLDDVKFNEEIGGLDLNYHVEQAGFLPPNTEFDVDAFWLTPFSETGVGGRAVQIPLLDAKSKHVHIPATIFVPPELDATGVLVRHGSAPGIAAPLINLEPNLAFIFSDTPFRKKNFEVELYIKNKAPVPLNVELHWSEKPLFKSDELIELAVTAKPDYVRGTQMITLPYMAASDSPYKIPLGKLNRTWDWIPPTNKYMDSLRQVNNELVENTIQNAAAELIDTLRFAGKKIAGPLLQIYEIYKLDDKFQLPSVVDSLPLDFTARGESLANKGVPFNATQIQEIQVPREPNKNALATFKQLAAISSVSASLAVTSAFAAVKIPALQRIVRPLVVRALEEAQLAGAMYRTAYDPPDFNFTQISEPIVSDRIDLPKETPGILQSKIRSLLHAASLRKAIAITEDRILGAQLSDNYFWEMNQRLALSRFQYDKAWIGQALAGESQLFSKAIQSISFFEDEANGDFEENGLSPVIVDTLRILNASDEEIHEFEERTRQKQFDLESNIDFSWQADIVQSMFFLSSSHNNLLEAIRIRTEKLELPIRNVAPEELEAIDDLEAAIRNQVDMSFLSRSLAQDILNYNSSVKTLLLASNNHEQLKDRLDFGYNAFFNFLLNDIRPDSLVAIANSLRQDGDISGLVESSILAMSEKMDEALSRAEYDVYESQVFSFHHYVDSLGVDDVTARGRSILLSFTNYVLESVINSDLDRNRHDVNSDRSIDPLDVLVLINRINSIGIGPVVPSEFGAKQPFFDVNKDGAIDPLDVLDLINYLNSVSYDSFNFVGEGEQQESSLPLDSKKPDSQIENFMLVDSFFEDFFPSTRSLRRRWL
ncbi:MAG: dockerin type I domain-containing protein [Pirellula sp.]